MLEELPIEHRRIVVVGQSPEKGVTSERDFIFGLTHDAFMSSRLIVSACLLGRACRYDGGRKPAAAVQVRVTEHEAAGGEVVSVCPEELGGLGTPRPAAEMRGGAGADVLAGRARVERLADGADVSAAFVAGARAAWTLGMGASAAVLKARSPSCGCGLAHRDGGPKPGDGVFAALLRSQGLTLQTDEELEAERGSAEG